MLALIANTVLCFFINIIHCPLSVLTHSSCSLTTSMCDNCAALYNISFAKARGSISQNPLPWVCVSQSWSEEKFAKCLEGGSEVEALTLGRTSQSDIMQGCLVGPGMSLQSRSTSMERLRWGSSSQLLVLLTHSGPGMSHYLGIGLGPTASPEQPFHRTLHKLPLHSPLYSQACLISLIFLKAVTCLPSPMLQVDCVVPVCLTLQLPFPDSTFPVPPIHV